MTPISADELVFDEDGSVGGMGAVSADDLEFDAPAPAPKAKKKAPAQPKLKPLGELKERARTFKPLQDPAPGYELALEQEPGGVVLQFPKGDSFKAEGVTVGQRAPGKIKLRLVGVRREDGESAESFRKRAEVWSQSEKARKGQERTELAQVRARTTPSRGPVGRVAEGFKTGFGETIRTAGVGASLLTGQEPDAVALEQPLPTIGTEDAKGWLSKGGQGLGSMAGFLMTSPALGPMGATLMGAAQNAGQTYEEARARGVSHDEALAAAVPGALIGALEGIGGGGGATTGFIKGTLGEAGQEGLSQVLNNINAKFISGYDAQRAITEGVMESALLGGLLGAGVHGIGAALTGRPAVVPSESAAPQLDALPKANPSFISNLAERQANLQAWHEGADPRLKGPDGQPIAVYHGTQSPMEIDQLDMSKLDPNALYGPGFYMTQDPEVAAGDGGYADTKPFRVSDAKIIEISQHHPEFGDKVRDYINSGMIESEAKAAAGHDLRSEGKLPELSDKPHAYKLYANIQRPFDIDAPLTPELIKAYRNDFGGTPVSKTGSDFYYELTQDVGGSKADANEWLKEKGFDGFTHIGGGRASRGQGAQHGRFSNRVEAEKRAAEIGGKVKEIIPTVDSFQDVGRTGYYVVDPANSSLSLLMEDGWPKSFNTREEAEAAARELGPQYELEGHRVWIAFDPTQVKSATGNQGTFTKGDPRLAASFVADPAERRANLLAWHAGADRGLKSHDGTPKVVYHGTRIPSGKGIEEFDFQQISRPGNGFGFHFAESPDLASDYAYQDLAPGGGGQVLPVYLNIQKPARPSVYAAASNRVYRQYKKERAQMKWEDWNRFSEQKIREDLVAQGYDGILHRGDGLRKGGNGGNVWVAFYPEQIKSATGNEGTFAKDNPRLSASFTSDQLLEMEVKAAQAGRPVALRPETVQSFHQQIGAINQELMRVDPTSPEFARLADRAVQLRRAVEEAPTPADLKDGKSMREWARRQNMWHDTAAQDLLDLLGITDESGTDTSLPGIKTNWDLYHRRVKSGERGARFYPLPASNNKGGTVFLSPQSMVDAGVIEAEEVGKIGGMNVSLNVAIDYARLAELGGYVDVATAIRGAIAEAQQKGLPKVALAMYVPGQGLKITKQFLRHESFHTGQQVAANEAAPTGAVGWNDPTKLVSAELLYHPIVAKVATTEGGQSVLAYYDGDTSALAFEMAAYAAAKQYNELGWTKEEADTYLADYLLDVLETSGVEALEGLAQGARLSAPVAKQVAKLTEDHYGRERQRRNRASSFAASLRAPSATTGPEGPAGGSSREAGRVGEGGASAPGVEGEVDGVSGTQQIIVYTGQPKGSIIDEETIQVSSPGNLFGPAIYLSEDPSIASKYASGHETGTPREGSIHKKILSPGNVLDGDTRLSSRQVQELLDRAVGEPVEIEEGIPEGLTASQAVVKYLDEIAYELNTTIGTLLQNAGYDSIRFTETPEMGAPGKSHTAWAVFDSSLLSDEQQARDYGELDADDLEWDDADVVDPVEQELRDVYEAATQDVPPTPPTVPTPPTNGSPGSPLTETVVAKDRYAQLREKLMQAVVAKGYKWDLSVPPGLQLAKALKAGYLDMDNMTETLAQAGMTVAEYADLAEYTQHRAGQIMNELSRITKEIDDLVLTNPQLASLIIGPNKVMQRGLKKLEATELGHSIWERQGSIMRKNFLSRLATAFTQVWSTTGQVPLDIASGAIAGLGMRFLNPAKWQHNTTGMLATAKEDVVRGIEPVLALARGMNPAQIIDLLRWQKPSKQMEYKKIVDDLSLIYPEIYGKLHGREDIVPGQTGYTSPAALRQVLTQVKDPALRREYEVKLRTLEGREKFNKSLRGKVLKGYENALDLILMPLSIQEYAFRRPMFVGALQRELEARGLDLNDFIANPQKVAGARDMLQAAVDEALRFTWAYEPKAGNKAVGQAEQALEGAAHYFVKFWNKLGPIGATLEAFPRALTNGLKFAYEWSPFGFISPAWQAQDKLRHGARDQITFQESQRMAQAVVGTMMYAVALGLREWAGGEEWWQLKTGKRDKNGKPIYYDVRRIPQLAFFLNAADLAKRASEDTLGDIKVEQRLKDTYLGARRNSQPGDLGAIDQFMLMWTGDTVPTNAKQKGKLAAGQWASTFVIPLSNIRDAWAQFSVQEGAKRDLRESPWLGPSLDKLPWLRRDLPLAEGPFEQSPQLGVYAPLAESEGLGPVTGAFALGGAIGATRMTPGQSFAAREFARLGLSPYTWLKRDPSPAIDRAQWARMTTILQAVGNSLANNPGYLSQSPDQQRAIWEEIIGGPEGAAAEAKAAGLEINPQEAERRKTLQAVPPYRRKAIGLDKLIPPVGQP